MGTPAEWDLQAENAGLRQQLADLREQLVAARVCIDELEQQILEATMDACRRVEKENDND